MRSNPAKGGMIYIGGLAIVFAVAAVRVRTVTRGRLLETPALGALSTAALTGSVLLLAMLSLPVTHWMARDTLDEIEPLRRSVLQARLAGMNIERSELWHEMQSVNRRLSRWRFLNETPLDPWVPDIVDRVDWIRPF